MATNVSVRLNTAANKLFNGKKVRFLRDSAGELLIEPTESDGHSVVGGNLRRSTIEINSEIAKHLGLESGFHYQLKSVSNQAVERFIPVIEEGDEDIFEERSVPIYEERVVQQKTKSSFKYQINKLLSEGQY